MAARRETRAMPKFEVQVTHEAWQSEDDDPGSMTRRIVGALHEVLENPFQNRELTVRFASDEDVRALNAEFRGRDKPTNVLSFPALAMPGDETPELGDVILAFETVVREAGEQGKTLADHTSHLVLHGVLHLLGFDHETDPQAQQMEALERDVLARLGIADPYAADMEPVHGA